MSTRCKISQCSWTGTKELLLQHCLQEHRDFVKNINDENYFNFTFNDLHIRAFLLNGRNELYWCMISPYYYLLPFQDGIERGIFAVNENESTVCDYMVKMGDDHSDYVEDITYLGPYPIRNEDSNIYDWKLSFDNIDYYTQEMPSKRIEVHFDTSLFKKEDETPEMVEIPTDEVSASSWGMHDFWNIVEPVKRFLTFPSL